MLKLGGEAHANFKGVSHAMCISVAVTSVRDRKPVGSYIAERVGRFIVQVVPGRGIVYRGANPMWAINCGETRQNKQQPLKIHMQCQTKTLNSV